jgi:RNA polymerase sigma-70 factor (ECF subfamily)
VEERQVRERVRRAVDALPERLRRVVVLTELAELSYADVARVLAIPEGTVASRRHAAVRRLRKLLGHGMEA